MVDDIDNHIDQSAGKGFPAWELPMLLLGGFRSLVDQAHVLLAERGHPAARPMHGFALQAVGSGATASEVGQRLGVSKQAAAKTLGMLEAQGYLDRVDDPADRRRRVVVPTARGRDLLGQSAGAFAEVLETWTARVGAVDLERLHATLVGVGAGRSFPLDLSSWSG